MAKLWCQDGRSRDKKNCIFQTKKDRGIWAKQNKTWNPMRFPGQKSIIVLNSAFLVTCPDFQVIYR